MRRSRATRCIDLSRRRVVFSNSVNVAGVHVASATARRTGARGFSAKAAANTTGSVMPDAIARAASALPADASAARRTAGWLRMASGVASSIRRSSRMTACAPTSPSSRHLKTMSGWFRRSSALRRTAGSGSSRNTRANVVCSPSARSAMATILAAGSAASIRGFRLNSLRNMMRLSQRDPTWLARLAAVTCGRACPIGQVARERGYGQRSLPDLPQVSAVGRLGAARSMPENRPADDS